MTLNYGTQETRNTGCFFPQIPQQWLWSRSNSSRAALRVISHFIEKINGVSDTCQDTSSHLGKGTEPLAPRERAEGLVEDNTNTICFFKGRRVLWGSHRSNHSLGPQPRELVPRPLPATFTGWQQFVQPHRICSKFIMETQYEHIILEDLSPPNSLTWITGQKA